MKVLVLGGLSRSLVNFRGSLLREMVARGHRVFTAAGGTTPEERLEIESFGVEHQDIIMERAGLSPLSDVKTLLALNRLISRVLPDIVFCYTIKPVIYGSIASSLAGVPRIYSMITGLGYSFGRGSWMQFAAGIIAAGLYRIALRFNSAVFFQNADDRRVFREKRLLGESTNTVLINGSGVDVGFYSPAPLPNQPRFLLIARLLWEKGIGEYVSAARLVRQRYPTARFFLVGGSDPNPSAISARQIEKWVDEGVIEYLGVLSDVRPAIAGTAAYVLPSYGEGLPRTVLEAMAMGRPVITTDAPGCRETVKVNNGHRLTKSGDGIIEGDNGFLVPLKDFHALARAMEEFIRHPELRERMGEARDFTQSNGLRLTRSTELLLETMGL